MRAFAWIIPFFLLWLPAGLSAKEAAPLAQDDVLEQRVLDLSKELRCLKCQNQSIADSKSGFADSVRQELRDQFRAGKDERDVKNFLIDRYGDFIVYEPPFTLINSLIWLLPVAVLLAGIAVLFFVISRQQKSKPDQVEVSPEQAERLKRLLSEGKS